MFHPPFGRRLPEGRRETGRKISGCAGQILGVGQASTRLAEVTCHQLVVDKVMINHPQAKISNARAMLHTPVRRLLGETNAGKTQQSANTT
jgi:hypothetical protein